MVTTTENPTRDSARWTGDGEGAHRLGSASLAFDETRVTLVQDGQRWEESFGHPDRLDGQGGFHAVLTSWLAGRDLTAAGLEDPCARIEQKVLEHDTEEQVRAFERAQAKLADAEAAIIEVQERIAPGSFEERVANRRVDLVAAIEHGIKPPEFVPGSDDTLVQGARHLIAAPRKVGKSIAQQATAVRIVLAGGRVAILDRENGARIYARRLDDMMDAWGVSPADREIIRANLHYYAFPALRREDRDQLAEAWAGFDLVTFDSQRGFLTNLGMKEDSSDDYARFMDAVIDPLHQVGTATLVLHNTGHGDKGRGRGSSSQGDLHDVLLVMKKVEPYFVDTVGKIHMRVDENREGTSGSWTMEIGGGEYGRWAPASPGEEHAKGSEGRKAANLAQLKQLLADDPEATDQALAARLEVSARTVQNYRNEIADGD